MLFKEVHLKGIQSGAISLAFRRWAKASVHTGTLLKTSIGLVEIVDLSVIDERSITQRDALRAGFESVDAVLKSLRVNTSGSIYKIQVRYHSADPRIELREQDLTDDMYLAIQEKLVRLDRYSKQGHWTEKILLTIQAHPHLHAVGISRLLGFEKEWLKINIRKLKNLGLTISHTIGYELSPLGREFVERHFQKK